MKRRTIGVILSEDSQSGNSPISIGSLLGERGWNGSDNPPECSDERDLRIRNPFRYPTDGLLKPLAVNGSLPERMIALEFQLVRQFFQLRSGGVARYGL